MSEEYRRIGNRLRQLRENRGLTQKEVGHIIGVSADAVRLYEKGRRRIGLIDLQKLADHFAVPLAYFLGRETETDRIHAELQRAVKELDETRERLREVIPYSGEWVWLPLIGTVPAAYPEWQDPQEAEECYPCFVEQIKRPDGAYALRVKGDLMIGRGIFDGDIIFVDSERQAQPGDVVVARKDDEVVLRTYEKDAKGPHLRAGNQGHPILRLKDARILGVVVGSYRGKA